MPGSGKSAEQAAAELERAAMDAGAVGGHLTHRDQALRNAAIVAGALTGVKPPELARRFGVDPTTVRRVLADSRKVASGLDERPMQLVEDLARAYLRSIAVLEAQAYALRDSAPATSVRASLGAIATREKLQELYASVGKLPDNLELFKSEAQLTQLAERMVEYLDRAEAGDASMGELRAFFRSLIGFDAEGRELPEHT